MAQTKADTLYAYLEAEEPTGRERTEDTKGAAAKYVAIKSMLDVCENAENLSLRDACIERVYQWYMEANVGSDQPRRSPVKVR